MQLQYVFMINVSSNQLKSPESLSEELCICQKKKKNELKTKRKNNGYWDED